MLTAEMMISGSVHCKTRLLIDESDQIALLQSVRLVNKCVVFYTVIIVHVSIATSLGRIPHFKDKIIQIMNNVDQN